MTFSAVTNTKVGLTVWSYTDENENRVTQLTVGTAIAHLTDEQRAQLAEYLAQ